MLNTCCGCWSLERGTKIIAWVLMVLGVITILLEAWTIRTLISISEGEKFFEEDIIASTHTLVETIPTLVLSVLLLIGIHKRHSGLILVSLVAYSAFTAEFYLTEFVDAMFLLAGKVDSMAVVPLEYVALSFVLDLYFFAVLFSYLKQVVQNQNQTGQAGSGTSIPYLGMV